MEKTEIFSNLFSKQNLKDFFQMIVDIKHTFLRLAAAKLLKNVVRTFLEFYNDVIT